jgi:Uri superfamily endonuclease
MRKEILKKINFKKTYNEVTMEKNVYVYVYSCLSNLKETGGFQARLSQKSEFSPLSS